VTFFVHLLDRSYGLWYNVYRSKERGMMTKSESKVVATRFPYPLYEQLEALRQKERRTKSNMVIVLVEEALRARAQQRATRV